MWGRGNILTLRPRYTLVQPPLQEKKKKVKMRIGHATKLQRLV